MNETLKVISQRRSIRRYKAEQIADSELQQILDSALSAPNAMNRQKWHFTVIQNKDVLDRASDIIRENIINSGFEPLAGMAKAPGYHTFYNAPTVILISGEKGLPFIELDCGVAAQNILLAAGSLNIGSCFIASSSFIFASEKGNELKKELGIPEGYDHVCTVALGYKDGETPAAPPRDKGVISYVK